MREEGGQWSQQSHEDLHSSTFFDGSLNTSSHSPELLGGRLDTVLYKPFSSCLSVLLCSGKCRQVGYQRHPHRLDQGTLELEVARFVGRMPP